MKKTLGIGLLLTLFACGSSPTDVGVSEVLGIPKGNGVGTGLSGEFTTIFEVTKNRCKDFPSLNVPAQDSTQVLNVMVTQEEGVINFKEIETTLRGGVDFDNTYEVGGAATISREGDQNILIAVHISGRFKDGNNFEGKGIERFNGQLSGQDVNCNIDFTVKGIRKGSAPGS